MRRNLVGVGVGVSTPSDRESDQMSRGRDSDSSDLIGFLLKLGNVQMNAEAQESGST